MISFLSENQDDRHLHTTVHARRPVVVDLIQRKTCFELDARRRRARVNTVFTLERRRLTGVRWRTTVMMIAVRNNRATSG